ncbi:MAG: DUF3224 domain-containing protein [Asticcacaulis sp.]|uniref:DUF3224 domain-containing protein n=1 Tax=Asticcacaulis sp. TaxID=1872648 RepID=UPI0039E337B5
MSTEITGPFDVKRTAEPVHDKLTGLLGRHALEKTYHGDLSATGTGEMLSAGGTVPGSAGYVAIERVEGTLNGRKGSFYLQHNGLMNRGQPSLSIVVIPDSGTDELTGLIGTMDITIAEGGAHGYRFVYSL